MAEWAKQQEEKRKKMELIDAMDRFPRALKVRIKSGACFFAAALALVGFPSPSTAAAAIIDRIQSETLMSYC